jgi:hypothetical protein
MFFFIVNISHVFKESLIKLDGQTTEPCSSNGKGKISPIAFLTSSTVAPEETFISSTLVTVDEAFCAMQLRVLSVFLSYSNAKDPNYKTFEEGDSW